jgi:hypothetical protein
MQRAAALCLAIFCISTLAAPPTTDPLARKLADHKAHEQQEYQRQLNDFPELKLPHAAITDIFDLSIDNAGMLAFHPRIHATDGPQRCNITGLNGPCSVTAFADKASPTHAVFAVQFIHRDFSNVNEIFRNTMLFAHPGSIQLSTDLDGLIQSRSVSIIQNADPDDPDTAVELYAQLIDPVTDDTIGHCKLSAPTFRELRWRYPRETQQFLVPILRDLQSQTFLAPDPRLAYQVFDTHFKPDAELSKKIDAALQKFDAEDFQTREAAGRDLSALGQPAALALIHADRKGWSIDRWNGVENFLSQYRALSANRLKDLKTNPAFLLDCLYSPDPQIRAFSAAALNPMLAQKIDPAATDSALDKEIDRAAATLLPPMNPPPTTQQ